MKGGQEYKGHIGQIGVTGTNRLEKPKPVQMRHGNIAQDEIGPL